MKNFIKSIIYNFFTILPIKKNKIVFNNFNSKGFGDNPKYIALELLKKKENYELVWCLNRLYNESIPEGIKIINGGIKELYHYATAKVWVSNVRLPIYYRKRRKQFYINTWHGGIGFKKTEGDSPQALSKDYLKMAFHDSKQIDLLLSNSDYLTAFYRRAFWYDGEILEKGLPRSDILIKQDKKVINKLKKDNNLEKYYTVLYAPTFRKIESKSNYDLDGEKLIETLEKVTSKKWKLLVRFHPNVIEHNKYFNFNNYILDFTNYPDIQELLLISDILITDYSSCIFDFLSLNRPSFIYASDIMEYKNDRGFNIHYDETPLQIATSNEELNENVIKFYKEKMGSNYDDYLKQYGMKETGYSSEEVVKVINEKMGI